MSDRDPFRESLEPDGGGRGDYSEIDLGGRASAPEQPARDLAVRELAEELFVLSRQQPGTPYGREQMEARLQTFLVEREGKRSPPWAPAEAARIIEELLRDGALDDEHARQLRSRAERFAESCRRAAGRLPGELAVLRGALEEAREAIASLPGDALGYNEAGVMHGPNGEAEVVRGWPLRDELLDRITKALAPGAGRAEAEVLRAATTLVQSDSWAEFWDGRSFHAPSEWTDLASSVDAMLAARGGEGEG